MRSLACTALVVISSALVACAGMGPKIERHTLTEGEYRGVRIGQSKPEVAKQLLLLGVNHVNVSAFYGFYSDTASVDEVAKLERFNHWTFWVPRFGMTLIFRAEKLAEIRTEDWEGERWI